MSDLVIEKKALSDPEKNAARTRHERRMAISIVNGSIMENPSQIDIQFYIECIFFFGLISGIV